MVEGSTGVGAVGKADVARGVGVVGVVGVNDRDTNFGVDNADDVDNAVGVDGEGEAVGVKGEAGVDGNENGESLWEADEELGVDPMLLEVEFKEVVDFVIRFFRNGGPGDKCHLVGDL